MKNFEPNLRNFILITGLIILISCKLLGQNPSNQNLRGTALDLITKQGLAGTVISIQGTSHFAVSNNEGEYIFKNIPVGSYTLTATLLGYNSRVISDVIVTSAKETLLDFYLDESPVILKEAKVTPEIKKYKPINDMAFVSARTFSIDEAKRFAGVMDDPGRMAANYAGVISAGISNNAVIVRGNAPKGVLWRLEGVEIPIPSHFSGSNVVGGGGLTIFSSHMMSNSDFLTGAFPAEYNNALSGVFDISLRNGNNSKKELAFQAGLQGLEFGAEGPLFSGSKSSFIANYRYSTLGLIFKLLPETKRENEVPEYQDFSFKLNLPLKNKGFISIWGLTGFSESKITGSEDQGKWIYPENRVIMKFLYGMGTSGISYFSRISKRLTLKNTISVNFTNHYYNTKFYEIENDSIFIKPLQNSSFVESSILLKSEANIKKSNRFNIRTGVIFNLSTYKLVGSSIRYEDGIYDNNVNKRGIAYTSTFYGQSILYLLPQLGINIGINASYFGLNNELCIEPRLAAYWNINQRNTVAIAYGLHSQREMLHIYYTGNKSNEQLTSEYPNKNLKLQKASHYVLSYNYNISKNMRFKSELYFQRLFKVPVVDNSSLALINLKNNWTFNENLVNKGSGKNYGIDITIEKFLEKGFYFISTSSAYRSLYKGGDGVLRSARYDGLYAISLLAGKEFSINKKSLLGINMKCSVKGPELCDVVNEDLSHLYKEVIYDYSKPLIRRPGGIESASDITISLRINGNKKSHLLSLQAKNFLGKEYRGKIYNIIKNSIEDDYFTSIVPFFSYKFEF